MSVPFVMIAPYWARPGIRVEHRTGSVGERSTILEVRYGYGCAPYQPDPEDPLDRPMAYVDDRAGEHGDWFYVDELYPSDEQCDSCFKGYGAPGPNMIHHGECERCQRECCEMCAADEGDGCHSDEGETYYLSSWFHHDKACAAYNEEM